MVNKVEKAYTPGNNDFLPIEECIQIDNVLNPLPVVKYPTTKSSKLIVNAKTTPEKIPPLIAGIMTLITLLKGLIPKSNAASIKFGSISFILGNTDKIIYGKIKNTWAIKIVQNPKI